MGHNKFNHEGYFDPVPYEALNNIDKRAGNQRSVRKNQRNNQKRRSNNQRNQKNKRLYNKNQCSEEKYSIRAMNEAPVIPSTKVAYICSPLRGDMEHNINMARSYCRFAVSKAYIPLAVHLLFTQFMDDSNENERVIALRMGTALLVKADEIWVFGNNITTGMDMEITEARRINLPIRFFTDKCMEVE